MKKHVMLVFMTACAFAASMTLKEKRDSTKVEGSAASTVKDVASTEGGAASMMGGAANPAEGTASTGGGAADTPTTANSTAANTNHTVICAPQTPCAWSAYHTYTKELVWNIRNKYCVCGAGTDCYVDEDDKQDYAYVYRCRTSPGNMNTVLQRSM